MHIDYKEISNCIELRFSKYLSELKEFVSIPGISLKQAPDLILKKSADWVKAALLNSGMQEAEIIELENCHPYIYAEKIVDPSLPTLLLYAHHDVQPIGRIEKWKSPPFKAEIREGRLYGRGTADDKAGLLMHLAALDVYKSLNIPLPLNLKIIVEGEEEIGSEHLEAFLKIYQEKLKADVMILTDTANLESGLPSLTYKLRGLLDGVMSIKVIEAPVHSGMWGGPVIDALSIASKLMASVYDEEGKIKIHDFYEGMSQKTEFEKENDTYLPYDEDKFRQEMGAVESLKWVGRPEKSQYDKIWNEPAFAILAIEAPSIERASNQIIAETKLKFSIRLAPGQDPERMKKIIKNYFLSQNIFGAELKIDFETANPGWKGAHSGPCFDAVKKALRIAYEREAVLIGCGGSIPFVKPMTEAFPNMPAILMGVEDPLTNAHGENESLNLEDWKKGMKAAVLIYQELAKALSIVKG